MKIGQVLIIPGSTVVVASSKPATVSSRPVKRTVKTTTHTVQRGEFLGKIATNYGVTVASIRNVNKLRSDELAVGQKLKIETSNRKAVKHTVKRGEFLGKIASRYGISVNSLRQANKLSSDTLAVGQKLTIPSS